MSLWILDTDTLTLFQTGNASVVQHVLTHPTVELAVTVISIEEQLGGWYTRLRRAKKPDELARVYQHLTTNVQTLSRIRLISFSEAAIHTYLTLKRNKLNIGAKDLRIAAIAPELNAVVVTRNVRDFP